MLQLSPSNLPSMGWSLNSCVAALYYSVFYATILSLGAGVVESCPRKCFCNEASQIVYCSRRGLDTIPAGIPTDTLQLNFNGNIFQVSTVERSNFSRFDALEHLYMSECGIERIQEDSFIDLKRLQWLDLSNNRIKVLQDFSFRGLSLLHLFLNGNRNIQLSTQAFEGLATTGLYLHECSLPSLEDDVLLPLNSTLRYLWLNGNELERVNKKLGPMFASLQHLRMGSNPLHCNCEVLWLKEFFDTHGGIFEGASPPSCLTPQKLKGKFFNQLSLFEFRCQTPVFTNIDAVFNNLAGRLRCVATGDPAPTIYWIQPSGHSSRYDPPRDEEARRNEGTLVLHAEDVPKEDLTGQYFCVAINEAGNVTLTLNASWPHVKPEVIYRTVTVLPPSPVPTTAVSTPETDGVFQNDRSRFKTNVPRINIDRNMEITQEELDKINMENMQNMQPGGGAMEGGAAGVSGNSKDSSNKADPKGFNFTALNMMDLARRNGDKFFNLTELIGAIIGTHVCTLLLCLIFMPLYYKRKWRQERERNRGMQKSAPNETLYLNGLGHTPYRDYLDTPTPTKR